MANRLIVNIRGANASGKTTLMRSFLGEPFNVYQLPAPDGTKVDFQTNDVCGLSLPICVIGKYDTSKYSGCDKIKSAEAIEWAVRHAVEMFPGHHVMFEGFRVSKSYKRFAALRNELAGKGETWLWALLHAPKELIWERSAARREENSREIDKKELEAVCRQMSKTRQSLMFNWPNDVLTLDPANSAFDVFERLRGEMAARERGETLGAK